LKTEPHRRWAAGLSCLCFVMVGAPLAIRLRNSDFLTSFFLCFLPILIVYYPLLAYGIGRAKSGAVPPQVVWLGNLILVAAGVWMTRRMMRY
jgi:lipopolysaccharide export system permease protein